MELDGETVRYYDNAFFITRVLRELYHDRHRVFAELVEQGFHSTLKLPVPKPPSFGDANSLAAVTRGGSIPSIELDALRSLGANPSHTLQHPGYYYYMAARCTELRKERFHAAVEVEVRF